MHILLARSAEGVTATELPDPGSADASGADAGGADAGGADAGGADTPTNVSELRTADLPAFVASREAERPRWVWDDTTRWYPELLAAGVRVERCIDLRLCHAILARSPFVPAGSLGERAVSDAWASLQPAALDEGTLFALDRVETALDAAAEFARQRVALEAAGDRRPGLALLLAAESSGALVAAELAFAGLPWDAGEHDRLLTSMLGPRPAQPGARPAVLQSLVEHVRRELDDPALNPDSPPELLRALRRAGLQVTSTRSWELQRVQHPAIPPLLEYKRLARLLAANGWSWLDTWVRAGRFHAAYVPGGVVTGRWAANGGGAMQLPAQIRGAVRADPGWTFVVADAAQLEPRVLAAMARDERMAEAARAADLYQGMVDSGAVPSREQAKYGMLGAIYGGTRGESGRMLPRLTARYPDALGFVEAAARAGERGEVVHTWLGRGSPRPGEQIVPPRIEGGDDSGSGAAGAADGRRSSAEARAWGRFTRNFVVQGTAAEWALSWMGRLRNRLWALGDGLFTQRPHLVFFLHDEVVVHTPIADAPTVADAVRTSAAEAGRILFGGFPVDFPLDVQTVTNYADAA